MRPVLVVLALAAVAAADPFRDYAAAMSRLAARERTFWGRFNQRFAEAARRYYDPIRRHPRRWRSTPGELVGIEALFREYANLERARASVYLGLAISGHERAAAELIRQIAVTREHIVQADGDLAENNERVIAELLDQKPGVRRHGLGIRMRGLAEALRRVPDTRDLLTRKLKVGSPGFRAALLDGTPYAGLITPYLRGKELVVRVAAIDGLVRLGRGALRSAYRNDPDPVIRRLCRPEAVRPFTTVFMGIPTRDLNIVYVLDGSWALKRKANDVGETYQQVLAAQLMGSLGRLPRNATFRVVMIGHSHNRPLGHAVLGSPTALQPHPEAIRSAVRLVESYDVATTNDDPHSALLRALEFKDTDTIFFAYHGNPRSCRFLSPDALAADIARRNRYVRATIHAVRLGRLGPDSSRLMKAVAVQNGGDYKSR